ncbi:MAG: hypothetical protein OEZ39_07815 [Gammaproteobacteria bacterium]|nr:hypothetical protein [Gammaproteobacteria bacterium]MDH5651766.1 hypothetical protein [Gammaproteobacteria bacterium]
MNNRNGLDRFDHVVVLMLENRSFDSLLGYLYEGGVPDNQSFAGLQEGEISLPVPKRATDYDKHQTVTTHKTEDYHAPYPDPGEMYQHVNTQEYDQLDPDNVGVDGIKMSAPYNVPEPAPVPPPMTGFVNDYINTLQALGKTKDGKQFANPVYEQYKVIMSCFQPESVNVLTTLAKEFAVFDHWFCSVPSETWCNRAFWHAGTSCGEVINPPEEVGVEAQLKAFLRWEENFNVTDNLFTRMNEKKVSWHIYHEEPFSLTRIINGYCNPAFTGGKFRYGLDAFKKDIAHGNLPSYSFFEPRVVLQHNDQHPSSFDSTLYGETHPGSVLLGEKLIWDIYETIRCSELYRDNTLFIITHDEHGGCFDHVPPPATVPPTPGMVGDKGFTFDRMGVRVPMVMVSAYIKPNTIVNDEHDHTSFIKMCCDKWGLQGLTDRDKQAKSFAGIFTDQPRKMPPIKEPVIPAVDMKKHHELPLNPLQQGFLHAAGYHSAAKNRRDSALARTATIGTVGEAAKHLDKLSRRVSPCTRLLCDKLGIFRHPCLLVAWILKKMGAIFHR